MRTQIEVIQTAAAEFSGTGEITLFPKSPSQNKLSTAKDCKEMKAARIQIPVIRLDDLCTQRGIDRIDILKIDVEGFECQVLNGAGRMLRERKIGAVLL